MRTSTVLFAGALVLTTNAYAQQHPTPPDTARHDTLHFVLTPLEVNAARERSAPPPVPNIEIAPRLLQQTPAANEYDLIRRVAGLEVHEQGQGPGFASDVVVRGFTSDHSQDVLLVVDGVPVNLPINGHAEGYAEWNTLLPAAISSARLLYGTASPLYGDFALGGVMEVFTAHDTDHTEGAISGSGYGDVGGWLRTGGKADNGGHLEAVDLKRNEGWRDHSDNSSGNVLLRGWHQLHNGRIEGGLNGYSAKWNSPGFVSLTQFAAEQLKQASNPTDGGDEQRLVAHARYVRTLGGNSSLQALAWGMVSRWNLFLTLSEDPTEEPSQAHELDRRHGAGGQIEFASTGARGDLTLGISGRADGAHFDHGPSVDRVVSGLEESFDASYQAGAAYGRWRRNIGTHLGIDAGARVDAIRHSSLDLLDTAADRISATHVVLSPKLGIQYDIGRSIILTGSLSRGFRSAVGAIEDPTRPLITAWSSDVGIHRRSGPVHMFLGLFRYDVANERQLDPFTLQISNTGSSVRQGVDAHMDWTPSLHFNSSISFTYNHARLRGPYPDEHSQHGTQGDVTTAGRYDVTYVAMQATSASDTQVPGVAKYFGSVRAEYRPLAGLDVNGAWRLNGPYVPIGEPDTRTSAYSLFDVGGSIGLGRGTVIDLSLDNILDAKYAELRASGFINPGAPRTLRLGVRKLF